MSLVRWSLFLFCLWIGQAWSATTTIRIETAQWRESAQDAGAPGQTVKLPHVLPRDLFAQGGRTVMYRLNVPLAAAPKESLSIFIGKVSLSGNVTLNGHDLGGCGVGPLERTRCLHQPMLLTAGPTLWRAGQNVIDIEVWGTANQLNGLSQVIVGPPEELYTNYHLPRLVLQDALVSALLWITVTLGVISLLAAASLRGDRIYLFFGLTALLRGLSTINPLGVNLQLDPFWFTWIFSSARLMAGPVCILTILAFFERRMPRLEQGLLIYTLSTPLLLLVAGSSTNWALTLAIPMLAVIIFLVGTVVRWTWTSRSRRDIALLLTALTLVAGGFHDIWRIQSPQAFMTIMLLPYATGVMLAIMGGMIVSRLISGLQTTANLNTILAERVSNAEADLRRQHQTIVELERASARVQERERFLRDLHDGLGSSLSAARIRLDDDSLTPQQVSQLLDECIDDMRLLLATSAPDGELSDALGDLRYRMDRRLPRTGLQMQWRLDLDGMPPVPAPSRLQLMRILQEALTNAIRHAQADRIAVEARWDAERRRLVLGVEDNGQGFSTDSSGSGRGMANMRYRAGQLQGHLAVDSSPRGTRVEFDWPVPA